MEKTNEVIKMLKAFRKYMNGKGKKYPQPGAPDITAALDFAIEHLGYRMPKEEFIKLSELAQVGVSTLGKTEKIKAMGILRMATKIVKKIAKSEKAA